MEAPSPSATQQPSQPPGGQPPFGASPGTGPTPNKGFEAAALQKVGMAVKILMEVASTAGVGTDVGKAALDAVSKLSKYVPPGSVTPASEKAGIENMAMKNAQQNQQMAALRQGPPGGAAPGGAPPGMPRAA